MNPVSPMIPDPSDLVFLPLGGCGEIGMNLNLYGHGGKWLMVDLGLTFADERQPGIDLILPDPTFISERRQDLLAIVLTHAHEDHLGALPYLWPRLGCPVYASPFAANLLSRKLEEAGLLDEVPLHVIAAGERLDLGPFAIDFLGVTHSIPEASSLAIHTAAGSVVHTGDWKLDPGPVVGPLTDAAGFAAVAEAASVLVCDSTNVLQPGRSGSEADLRPSLLEVMKGHPGRIAVTTFASNVARIETVAQVAVELDRHVVLAGRALRRNSEAAQQCGYLGDLPEFLSEDDYAHLPSDRVLLMCSGCQGEPRGTMTRVANGSHPRLHLDPGDLAVFSSKIIPGNERALSRVHNDLVLAGVEVVSEKDAFVHVSGHPARDEISELYGWLKPALAVPVHGEARHLEAHVRLARSLGVPEARMIANGDMLRLCPGPAEVVEQVPAGRLLVDGDSLVPEGGQALQARRKIMFNGLISVTLVIDEAGDGLAPPKLSNHGAFDALIEPDLPAALEAAADQALDKLSRQRRRDDDAVAEAVRVAVRRAARAVTGRRPLVKVELVRLDYQVKERKVS